MAVEVGAVMEWFYDALSGDAVGVADRVYADVAPREATYPLVVFQLQAPGTDLLGVGTTRILTSGVWVVKAIDQVKGYTGLISIADAIDGALHGEAYETKTDGVVLGAVRERPFVLTEFGDGVEWKHLGGVYRVWAQ